MLFLHVCICSGAFLRRSMPLVVSMRTGLQPGSTVVAASLALQWDHVEISMDMHGGRIRLSRLSKKASIVPLCKQLLFRRSSICLGSFGRMFARGTFSGRCMVAAKNSSRRRAGSIAGGRTTIFVCGSMCAVLRREASGLLVSGGAAGSLSMRPVPRSSRRELRSPRKQR